MALNIDKGLLVKVEAIARKVGAAIMAVYARDNFGVNIALIEKDRPLLGVVYAPVLDTMYAAVQGVGTFNRWAMAGAPPYASPSMNRARCGRSLACG